ncbi:MAG: RICIN domain-containing protein [Chitinophagaceae bacterium]|nr:RICIN domain-containing protein [Chitinophagaceae bacterium]
MKIPAFFLISLVCAASCKQGSKFDPATTYKIEAKHSGKHLTLSYNRPLQTISDTTNAAFRWQLKYYPDSTAQIISLPTEQAIELAAVKDQVLPYITGADSNNVRQRFRITKNSDSSAYLESVYNTNYCIDISESDTSDFPVITTWPKENNPNQKWKLQATGNSVAFVSLLNGKYLAVTPPVNEAGANIGQWPFADRKEQIWMLQEQANGTYLIRNAASGMFLQEADGKLSLKYNVHQSRDAEANNSLWHLDDAKDGFVKFRNMASGYCMDVRDGVPYDGANVMTYDCKDNFGGGDNQLWKIVEVNNSK